MNLKILIAPALCMTFFFSSIAQVGIGTTAPEGVLDVNQESGTNTYGLVLPRVTLSRTDLATPVIDPDDAATPGTLPAGTVVYNTATTSFGRQSVYPGIYMWDGSEWINEFPKKDAEIFKQFEVTGGGPWVRTETSAGYQDIDNLVGQSFSPAYSGTYKIEVSVNFGSGQAADNGSETDVAVQKGNFRFTFNGTDYDIPIQSWSTVNSGGSRYYDIWEQATVIYYQDLVAGTSYSFSLRFDQTQSDGFQSNGDSGDGMGWIGRDLPCTVEFIYLD